MANILIVLIGAFVGIVLIGGAFGICIIILEFFTIWAERVRDYYERH